MYYDFFGFREPPFSIAPDPRYLYLSARHKEALAHLMYGIQGQGGFIVITGEVGTGKTTVCRCFIENAPPHVDIALILNPRLSARELLSAICDELGISHAPEASIKVLVDAINHDLLKAHAEGRHKVLVIDEAQNLSADVLEQLRLLTNLETAEKKLLQIVLIGQPELQELLALPELRQLSQRITARYHLDAIERAELPEYLHYRVSVAGIRGEIFTPGAIRQLYRSSHGIPRLINLIADRALLGAYSKDERQINKSHIRQAAREVQADPDQYLRNKFASGNSSRHIGIVVASVILAVLGTVWLVERQTDEVLPVAASETPQTDGKVERSPQHAGSEAVSLKAESPLRSSIVPFNDNQQGVSLAQAFILLFDTWGESFDPSKAPRACEYSLTVGLACLEERGSRRSLQLLNRPAILTLRVEGKPPTYVVLLSLYDNIAVIGTPEGRQTVSFDDVEAHWYGHFYVLWQAPDYMIDGDLHKNGPGEELWVGAHMMQLAERLGGSESEIARVKAMAMNEQVQWYQQQRGLKVDGIPGARTLIQINDDLSVDVPRLSDRSGTSRGR
jgi:general secretion pathway protein A